MGSSTPDRVVSQSLDTMRRVPRRLLPLLFHRRRRPLNRVCSCFLLLFFLVSAMCRGAGRGERGEGRKNIKWRNCCRWPPIQDEERFFCVCVQPLSLFIFVPDSKREPYYVQFPKRRTSVISPFCYDFIFLLLPNDAPVSGTFLIEFRCLLLLLLLLLFFFLLLN